MAVSVRHSLTSLRSLLVEIYPPDLAGDGLGPALDDLLAPAVASGVSVETICGHRCHEPGRSRRWSGEQRRRRCGTRCGMGDPARLVGPGRPTRQPLTPAGCSRLPTTASGSTPASYRRGATSVCEDCATLRLRPVVRWRSSRLPATGLSFGWRCRPDDPCRNRRRPRDGAGRTRAAVRW